MKLLLTSALLLSAGTTGLPTVPSDGLRRERLPAAIDFVLHLDVEGLQSTELWRQIRAMSEAQIEIEELEEIESRFGLDPFTDIHAVTLYKMKDQEDPTVALFATSDKVDEALRHFQEESGYRRVEVGAIQLHTWQEAGDDDEAVFAYLHSLGHGERVAVISSNQEGALLGARVLRGEATSHASGGSPLSIDPAPGSFLYAAATHIPHLEEFSPASQVFGLAQGIQVDLGEAGGFLRAHLAVLTELPEKAQQVADVFQGLVALGSLAGEEIGPALELLRALRIRTAAGSVTVDFEFGVLRLLEIFRELDEGDYDHDHDEDEEDEPR